MTGVGFSRDSKEFLGLLMKHKVRYMIVGGEAVIFYGYARLTGDIDIFYEISKSNAVRLYDALNEFWAGKIPGIESAKDLTNKGVVLQFGAPPQTESTS